MSKHDDWRSKVAKVERPGVPREIRNEAVKHALAAMGGQPVPARDLVLSADIISKYIHDGVLPSEETPTP